MPMTRKGVTSQLSLGRILHPFSFYTHSLEMTVQKLSQGLSLAGNPPLIISRQKEAMANEIFGWISVLTSLLMGMYMGVKFQRADWLGGYNAFPRRMVRLAHIALAALGTLNIIFAQTAPRVHLDASLTRVASVSYMAGGVLMPACCVYLAFRGKHFGVFALPIACLVTGLILTIGGLLQ
jgi:ethanolamine transporter EutH